MRAVLFVTLAVVVSDARGGAITSGDIYFETRPVFGNVYANLSGINFQASLDAIEAETFPSSSPYPFLVWLPNYPLGSDSPDTGMYYNGTFYTGGWPAGPPPGTPFVTQQVTYTWMSDPTITGPGSYPMTASVVLSFCLYHSTGDSGPFYCETDTGIATGALNYVSTCSPDCGWVSQTEGLTLVFAPEPSTLSYVGFSVGFGCLIAVLARTRRPAIKSRFAYLQRPE